MSSWCRNSTKSTILESWESQLFNFEGISVWRCVYLEMRLSRGQTTKSSIRNRSLEAFLRSEINNKHHFGKLRVSAFQRRGNSLLRMRRSRDMTISNRTTSWSDEEVVNSKSLFRGLPEVENQQEKSLIWKTENSRNTISKELTHEDASISRFNQFESDHFVVRRLCRHAFGK